VFGAGEFFSLSHTHTLFRAEEICMIFHVKISLQSLKRERALNIESPESPEPQEINKEFLFGASYVFIIIIHAFTR
jgi:hypothetical protein